MSEYYKEDCYGEDYYDGDVLEQYQVEIADIIQKAVNTKIKETIEEIASLKIRIDVLSKEKKDLHNEIRQLKNDMEKAIKETEEATARKFSLGFLPHDTVWIVDSTTETLKCKKCDGKGDVLMTVLGKETKVKCPHCSYGHIYKTTYIPKQATISSISYYLKRKDRYNKNSGVELYKNEVYLEDREYSTQISNLYKTLKECQSVCDQKNAEEEKKWKELEM